jgi:hypothetical protein
VKYCLNLPNGAAIVGQWLYDWQTLVSGLLALLAAWWAGRLILKQIGQVEQLNRDQARRRLTGTRVRLPAALSTLLGYCGDVGASLAVTIERLETPEDDEISLLMSPSDPSLEQVAYPTDAVQALAEFVESLDNRSEEKHVAELLASLQILAARFESQRVPKPYSVDALHDLLLDAGKVKYLAESMFNFARFAEEVSFAKVGILDSKEAWRAIQQATLGLVFDRPRIDWFGAAIRKRIDRYIESGSSPWIEKFEA